MATGPEVLSLARAALDGDRDRIANACRLIAVHERQGSSLRQGLERLLDQMSRRGSSPGELVPLPLRSLLLQITPRFALGDVMLPPEVSAELAYFLAERTHAEKIRDAGLPVPHRILLSGPPGNGKTTLAGAISRALELPFLMLDFSSIVSSYMGKTGAQLAEVFRGLSDVPCVLFADEMETILTERAAQRGKSDVGEMSRVVSTVLLEIDRLVDKVVFIGATNHAEMLDRAVVRRFDHHWSLPAPTDDVRRQWMSRFAERHPEVPVRSFSFDTEGLSLSDLERITHQHCRRWIVSQASETGEA